MITLSNNMINYNKTCGHEEADLRAPPHDLLHITASNHERSFPTLEIVETITPTVAFLWNFQQYYPSYSSVCSVVMEMDLLPCELSNCNDFIHVYFQGSSSFFKCS